MADTGFYELEYSDEFERWVTALKAGDSIIIDDMERIRETSPEEYQNYRRLKAEAIIGIPFWKRPTGFLVVRNPKKYRLNSNMLRIMAYVAVSTVHEHQLITNYKAAEKKPQVEKENDLYVNLMGNLEVHGFRLNLDERRINAPMGWNILVYLLLHRQRNVNYGELAWHLWQEMPTKTAANKVRGAIYRFRRYYEGLADEYLTVSEGTGYGLNPFYQITTDTDLFEMYWIQANELHSRTDRIELLKKAFELYRGPLFQTAVGATWMMQEYFRLTNQYTQIVNILLEDLYAMKNYSDVREYAARSFLYDPHNNHAHFWMIMSFIKNKNNKLARDALENAGNLLSSEDYGEMLIHLKKLVPDFVLENQS